MVADLDGQAFIKSHEGLRLKAYMDQAENWTQGWGHKIHDGVDASDWTLEYAEEVFQKDLRYNDERVSSYLSVPYKQCQFNALVDFSFNLGADTLKNSTLIRIINVGDWQAASKEILKWCHIHNKRTGAIAVENGLLARRTQESALLLAPIIQAKKDSSVEV